jgi:hypothetical protein
MSFSLSIKKSHSAVIPAGETVELNYTVIDNYSLFGCDYIAKNFNIGDHARFEVWHPLEGKLDEFADLYVRDAMVYQFENKAHIPAGLIVRVIYNNIGPNDVEFNMNILGNKIL